MKIQFTLYEGGDWIKMNMERKVFHEFLAGFVWQSLFAEYPYTGSIKIDKCPIIYDFALLRLNNQPWIRRSYTNGA